MKVLTKEEWMKRKKRRKYIRFTTIICICLFSCIIIILIIKSISTWVHPKKLDDKIILENGAKIEQNYLTPNPNSRPQISLKKVTGIVIHYVGNPGTTALQNRSYFENLKDTKETSASSHYVIGMMGEIVQCIPLEEIAYASKERNINSISIEFCHEGIDGKPNDNTYESLVELSVSLCKAFKLTSEDIIRHYDVTDKICPKYYVDNEDAWNLFRKEISDRLNK